MSNISETETYDLRNPVNAGAALSMIMIGSFGVICNGLMVYVFYKEKTERTSFNLICLYRAGANLHILLTTFFGDFIPATILGHSLYSPSVETLIIVMTNSIYVVNEYITIIVAVNRFFALFFPILYTKLFRFRMTLIYLIGIHVYRLSQVTLEIIESLEGCYLMFFVEILTWMDNEKCKQVGDNTFIFTFSFLIVVSVMNFATFMKIIMFYKNGASNQDHVSRRKIRGNIRLFFQTLLQDSLFLMDLTATYKLIGLFSNRVWTFICGSQIWQCLHSFDGFIMIMFNERLSLIKSRLMSTNSVTKDSNVTKTDLPTVE